MGSYSLTSTSLAIDVPKKTAINPLRNIQWETKPIVGEKIELIKILEFELQ